MNKGLNYKFLNTRTQKIKKFLKTNIKNSQKITEEFFNTQSLLESLYRTSFLIRRRDMKESKEILFTAFAKNLLALYTSIELTNRGLYGPARLQLRYVYEFLILAKYCDSTNDLELMKTWDEGREYISLDKKIFRYMTKPDCKELQKFWWVLCKFTHPTVFSMQNSLDADKDLIYETKFTHSIIRILIYMNYYLLSNLIFNHQVRYTAKIYKPKIRIQSKLIGNKIKTFNKYFSKDGKLLIGFYKSEWLFNPALKKAKPC